MIIGLKMFGMTFVEEFWIEIFTVGKEGLDKYKSAVGWLGYSGRSQVRMAIGPVHEAGPSDKLI